MTKRGSDKLVYDSENRFKEMRKYEGREGTHTYRLRKGKNLISFTYLPEDKSIINVLSALTFGTDYDEVSYWDPVSNSRKCFVNDSNLNNFANFDYGKSYEINIVKEGGITFTVSGKSPAVNIKFDAKVGDNFIGPAVKGPKAVAEVLQGWVLGTDYSDVLRYNAATSSFESFAAGAFTNFERGRGYILKSLKHKSFSFGQTLTTTTFVYDSTGSRVKKTTGTSTTVNLGKDYEVEGSLTTKHIFLGDQRIATSQSTGNLFFIHSDHINSSNVITDASGNQSALIEYDPYGSTVTQTGSVDLKYKFTGQENDDSTKLYYYNARYYDPQLGRFITADWVVSDPSNPQELNRYSYVNNNPVKFNDPTGHRKKRGFWSKFFKIFFIVVAVVAAVTFVAGALGALGGLGAGGAGLEGFTPILINQGMTAGDWIAGTIAAASAGAAVASNQIRSPEDRGPENPVLNSGVSKMLDRVGMGLQGTNPPSLLNNLPNYGTWDTPTLGGIGAVSSVAMQVAANVKAGVASPVEGVYNANEARSGGRKSNIPKALSKFWNRLKPFRGNTKTDGKYYYQWDHTHGDIEKYDKTGRHLGSLDPQTGQQYKGPENYTIDV